MKTTQPIAISVIFPDASPMWREAEQLLRGKLPDDRLDFTSFGDRDAAGPVNAEVVLAFALDEADAIRATALRWIQSLGSGTDALAAAAKRGGALLTSAKGLQAAPVSEAVIAAMLGLARGMAHQVRAQDSHRWEPRPARLLTGASVGIVGTGEIACAVARKCRAFGMKIVGFSAQPRALPDFDSVLPRDELIASAGDLDHVILLTALDDTTRHLAGQPLFTAMKPSAFLFNFGRGSLIDEDALVAALQAGEIGGAGLDTFAAEPLPSDHVFWTLGNVLVTPHSAGRHFGYVDDVIALFLYNLAAYRNGDTTSMKNLIV